MDLTSFPAELLNIITSYLYAQDLLNLWLCGSRRLNNELSERRGATAFRLVCDGRNITFPRFVYKFHHLEHLEIKTGYFLKCYGISKLKLSRLPATLKSIEFLFEDSQMYLISAPALSIPQGLSDTYHHIEFKKNVLKYMVDLKKTFPNLEKLSLDGGSSDTSSKPLANFPSSLKRLHLLSTHWKGYQNFYDDLPPELTSLKMRDNSISSQIIASLNNLTELHLGANRQLSRDFVRYLPQSIKHLDLEYQTFDLNELVHLPTQLLSFTWSPSNFTRGSDSSLVLPRSLTYLEIDNNTPLDDQFILGLPQSLQSLIMHNTQSLTDAAKLPPLLTSFQLRNQDGFGIDLVKSLSPNMRQLKLPVNSKFTDEAACFLPQRLESLCLTGNDEHLTDKFMENLSHTCKNLTRLELGRNKFTQACVKWLPRNLRSLELSNPNLLDTSSVPELPANLEILNIKYQTFLSHECAPLLPRSLTWLHVSGDAFADLSMALLPRGLLSLCISSDQRLTDKCIPGLPRSLLRFEVKGFVNFTDEGLHQLPRSLTELSVQDLNGITEKGTKSLPTGMSKLIVSHPFVARRYFDWQKEVLTAQSRLR